MNKQKVDFNYVLLTIIAVVFTWMLHEFSHWLTGELLGNNMAMTLNTSYAVEFMYIEPWHRTVVDAAGPLITLVQAFVFYYLLKTKRPASLFPFLLTCLYMRALASIMNFISVNDEGRISETLGIGMFTLPVLVTGILLYLLYDIVKERIDVSAKLIVVSLLLIMAVSSAIIMADQFLSIRIL